MTRFAAVIGMTVLTGAGAGQDAGRDTSPSTENTLDADFETDLETGRERLRELRGYGARGQTWVTAIGAVTLTSTEPDAFAGFQATRFVLDRFEVGGEVSGFGSVEDGSDEVGGVSAGLIVRYHAIERDWGTFFVSGGFGLLFSSGDVPPGGTSVNFLPRFGAGVSLPVGDDGGQRARWLLGVRWHHISNARLNGDDNNPSRDDLMAFVGYQFAF